MFSPTFPLHSYTHLIRWFLIALLAAGILLPFTPGQAQAALSLNTVEPGSLPAGQGGRLTLLGTGFNADCVARLVGWGALSTQFLNSQVLSADAPPALPAGQYDVQVSCGESHSALLPAGFQVLSQPTPTPHPAPATSTRRTPQVVLLALTPPADGIHPDQPFSLVLALANQGSGDAQRIRLALPADSPFLPAPGSPAWTLDSLPAGAEASLEIALVSAAGITPGFYPVDMTLEYQDSYKHLTTTALSFTLQVSAAAAGRPRLVLPAFQVSPQTIFPGDIVTLTLELANLGDAPARQVSLTSGGENGLGLAPFSPLGSGNVIFLAGLPAEESRTASLHLLVSGSAAAGAYNLPIEIASLDPSGGLLRETQVVSLQVYNRVALQVAPYREISSVREGSSLRLPLEITNTGTSRINTTHVEISSPNLLFKQASFYIGRLDPGGLFTLDASGEAVQAGKAEITVTIHYLDDFNHPCTSLHTLTVEIKPAPSSSQHVEPAPTPVETQSGGWQAVWQGILRFFRGIFGLGS